ANNLEAARVTDAARRQPVEDRVGIPHLEAIDADDDIAELQSRLGCGTVVGETYDNSAGDAIQFEVRGHFARHGLALAPEPRPLDLAAGNGIVRDQGHEVRGDGKADADRPARLREDHRVDAGQPAVHVDEGAARVAGIDGSVRLQKNLCV